MHNINSICVWREECLGPKKSCNSLPCTVRTFIQWLCNVQSIVGILLSCYLLNSLSILCYLPSLEVWIIGLHVKANSNTAMLRYLCSLFYLVLSSIKVLNEYLLFKYAILSPKKTINVESKVYTKLFYYNFFLASETEWRKREFIGCYSRK